MESRILLLAGFLILCQPSVGQKLKYKNIYPLLEAKNYTEGEPLLRQFLNDPKNSEEPNANYQLALIYELATTKLHIVKDSSKLLLYSDSATATFTKAKQLIDDKELKKNDEFYQSFHRRDLRTGEFGIKLSDVHLEIEKKITLFKNLSKNVMSLAVLLPRLQRAYDKSSSMYRSFAEKYSSTTELALATNKEVSKQLNFLVSNGDNIAELVDRIQDRVASITSTTFNSNSVVLDIKEFGKDGLTPLDAFAGDYKLWDYKGFAKEVLRKVDGDMGRYKQALVELDLNFQRKLRVVERAEELREPPSFPQDLQKTITELDPEGLPIFILRFKKAEIAYKAIEIVDEDSTFITKQLKKIDTLYQLTREMEADMKMMKLKNNPLELQKYETYVTQIFKRPTQLNKYIKEKAYWILNRKELLDKAYNFWKEIDKWGVHEDYRVPLFIPETLEGYDLNYLASKVEEESDYFMNGFGFKLDESPYHGYFVRLDPSRKILWKDQFTLKSTDIQSLIKSYRYEMIPSEDDKVAFVLSFEDGINQPVYRYFNYSTEGKKNWDKSFKLKKPPHEVKFNDLTKETIIYLNDPENLAEGQELAYIVIDRSGKVRR